ncbi:hypothetical protein GGTG_13862, partial [Gaeumannomyces tritici R3-111a-1]
MAVAVPRELCGLLGGPLLHRVFLGAGGSIFSSTFAQYCLLAARTVLSAARHSGSAKGGLEEQGGERDRKGGGLRLPGPTPLSNRSRNSRV